MRFRAVTTRLALLFLLPLAIGCTPQKVLTDAATTSQKPAVASHAQKSNPARKRAGAVASGTCAKHIKTTRDSGLVAERTSPGHTHYIEFRVRMSLVQPSGHMHVVYGELDNQAVPQTYNYVGLFPKGSVFGLYTGIFLPISISGDITPSALDCSFKPVGAYRVSITAQQYEKLLARIAVHRKNPPNWRMLSYNCNHFAAELGETVGLKSPSGARSNQFLSYVYFQQLLRVNGETPQWQRANGSNSRG